MKLKRIKRRKDLRKSKKYLILVKSNYPCSNKFEYSYKNKWLVVDWSTSSNDDKQQADQQSDHFITDDKDKKIIQWSDVDVALHLPSPQRARKKLEIDDNFDEIF